jgi:hypothetical protein
VAVIFVAPKFSTPSVKSMNVVTEPSVKLAEKSMMIAVGLSPDPNVPSVVMLPLTMLFAPGGSYGTRL